MGQVRQSNSAVFARKVWFLPYTGEVLDERLRDGPRQQRGTENPHNLHTRARPGNHGKDSKQRPPPPLRSTVQMLAPSLSETAHCDEERC